MNLFKKFGVSLVLLVAAFCAQAATETVSGIKWTYKVSNGKAEIYSGSSSFPAIPSSTKGAITIPSTLGGYPVTSIGGDAFYKCSGLTSVTIPDSVTSIGDWAFYECSGLTSVTIGNSVTRIGDYAFEWCGGLTSVTIPNSVTSIGDGAFGCSGLTSVTIPDSVTRIGDYAFYNCSGLTSMMIPDSVTSIGSQAFSGCSGLADVQGFVIIRGVLYDYFGEDGNIDIPDSVTSIGDYAFYECSGLTGVTIPDSVTIIGSGAFYCCSGLTSVTIGDSVTSIGDYAFEWCGGLTSVTIPNSVTIIGDSAFGCSGLTSVTIPDSVTSIGTFAFGDCSSLTSVTIPDSITSIGSAAFYCCSGLTSVTIGDSVTSIGSSAFEGCSGLTSMTIPDSVTSIGQWAFSGCISALYDTTTISGVTLVDGWAIDCDESCSGDLDLTGIRGIADRAFEGCSGLTSVMIPNSVTSIGSAAFYCCSGLTSVTIPDSVTSIGDSAFCWCTSLTNIVFAGNAPNYVSGHAFDYCHDDCTVYVTKGSTGWNVDIPGTWNGIKIDYSTIWSTGFEGFSSGDTLIGTSGSHFLYAGYDSDNESVVGSHGGVMEFDEPCGYASPFADMGTNYFCVNTGTDPVWISPYPVTGDGKLGGRYVPDAGEAFVVDAIVQFTETPMGDSVSIGGMPDVQVDSGNGIGLASVRAQTMRLAIRHCGTVMPIDDKIALYKQEICENGVCSSVWSLIAGVKTSDGSIEERNLVLESADALNPIPDPGYQSDGKWVRVTVKAIHDIKSRRLEFEVYLNGALAKSGGKTRFLPCPSAKDKTGISAVGFAGEGRVDNVVFSNELSPALVAPVIYPVSGMTFDNSLSVSISCETEGAAIYYTTDGSEPTKDSTVYKRFKIYGKTTVKAIAYDAEHDIYSEVTTANYAHGLCANPVIAPDGGSAESTSGGYVFYHDGQTVTISRNGDEGTIRYTLDGSDPTAESAIYSGAITIDDTTTIKAKVFSDRYFDSETVTVAFIREWEQVTTPEITVAPTFTGSKTKCEIVCATDGARIHYTLDGSDPTSHSQQYTGAFYITESCKVKAIALLKGYLNSEIAEKTVAKVWEIGDTMGAPDHAFTTSGDGGKTFYRVEDASAPGGEAMRSGDIEDSDKYGTYARTVLSTTVIGPGTVSFSWKASCEDDAPDYEWDHGEFAVDGVVKAYISGETEWKNVSVTVEGSGEHTLSWTYLKDDVEYDGDDCIWVTGFDWESAEAYTHTTDVKVPYEWLLANWPDAVDEYEAYETAAKATAANGRKVWECYVLGLDPTDPLDDFRITRFWMENGEPKFEFSHRTDGSGNSFLPYVKPLGKAQLSDKWRHVPEGGNSSFRFFTVEVVPPGCESSIVDEEDLGGVQLWEGGPYWAECNVGATKPEEYGYYFWWGDTVGYARSGGTLEDYYYSGVTWVSSKGEQMSSSPFTESACPTYGKDNSALLSAGYIDSTGNLAPAHDAATAHLGSPWRMPTKAEIDTLVSKCTISWTIHNGVYGQLVTGKGDYADKSIFLPAAGFGYDFYLYHHGLHGDYWSATRISSNSFDAWSLSFSSGNFNLSSSYDYRFGQSVRPVREFAK